MHAVMHMLMISEKWTTAFSEINERNGDMQFASTVGAAPSSSMPRRPGDVNWVNVRVRGV